MKVSHLVQWKMDSLIGPLFLVVSPDSLCGIHWKKQKIKFITDLDGGDDSALLMKKVVTELTEYFQGMRKDFDLPLDLEGTAFQKSVWKELQKIPYGKTISYKKLAQNIKNEKATRAVGTANGKNPISIIIPCHRVIAANGSLGGYAGGLKVKEKLLGLEQGQI